MADKTPDQIRRDTVPVRHSGIAYGLLVGVAGTVLIFSAWAGFHLNQVVRYPDYIGSFVSSNLGKFSLFPVKHQSSTRLTADQLRYALLRYGNENHRLDADILQHGWYPRNSTKPAIWVRRNGGIAPVFTADPLLVFRWPLALSLLFCVASLTIGLSFDHRYRMSVISGIYLDGTEVVTTTEYNRITKGDGMRYRVSSRRDR